MLQKCCRLRSQRAYIEWTGWIGAWVIREYMGRYAWLVVLDDYRCMNGDPNRTTIQIPSKVFILQNSRQPHQPDQTMRLQRRIYLSTFSEVLADKEERTPRQKVYWLPGMSWLSARMHLTSSTVFHAQFQTGVISLASEVMKYIIQEEGCFSASCENGYWHWGNFLADDKSYARGNARLSSSHHVNLQNVGRQALESSLALWFSKTS